MRWLELLDGLRVKGSSSAGGYLRAIAAEASTAAHSAASADS